MSLEVNGMSGLLKRLERMPQEAERVKEAALDKGAEHLRKKIALNTQRSSANKEHAADNVVIEKNGDLREVGYSKDHFYMQFVEFGTSKITARPVVQPTYENEIETAKQIMADEVRKVLDL